MVVRRLHVPMLQPEDVIPHLAKQQLHWRAGYSAQELAFAWWTSNGHFPPAVRAVLATAPEYATAEFVDGFFELEVELGSSGRNSQTDLMIVAGLSDRLAVIAVEGKVEESFAEIVKDWNDSSGKQRRLERLCETLGLDPARVAGIKYQLLHRTASAIYEAKRYRCRSAMMLVHSFSPTHRWFEDLDAFACAMGVSIPGPNRCSSAKQCDGVELRLAWVGDRPRPAVTP